MQLHLIALGSLFPFYILVPVVSHIPIRSCSLFILGTGLWFAGLALADEPGKALYEKNCAVCHGNEGDGRGRAGANLQPPATVFVGSTTPREQMLAAVASGKPGTAMVGYARKLDEAEIATVVDYIRGRFMAAPAIADSSPEEPSVGRELYFAHCAVCHGDKGSTAVWARNGLMPAPRDFTTAIAKEELSPERMVTSVTYGRPGTAMMPFKGRLNDEQIAAVVAFVRDSFMQPSNAVPASVAPIVALRTQELAVVAPPNVIDMNAPMPNGLAGDAKKGREFFMHNCFTCHGKNGDGQGPRAYFNRPPPRNFTSEESRGRFSRPRLFDSISRGKPGSVMPAWSTVLNSQQIADVGEFVFQTFIQPDSSSAEKKSLHSGK